MNDTTTIEIIDSEANNAFGDVGLDGEDFTNPTPENPVRVQDILKRLDMTFLDSLLAEMYGEDYRFQFPRKAVLKLMLYWKLAAKKSLKAVHNDLLTDPTLADALGFGFDLPSYQQLYHWLNLRMGRDGVHRLFDAFLAEFLKEAGYRDIQIGRELMLDSTPIEASPKGGGDFNPKYRDHGEIFKLHNLRDVDTGLPLEYHVSNGLIHDSNLSIPLIYRLRNLHGIKSRCIYMDGAYVGGKDMERLKEYWFMDYSVNVPESYVFRENKGRWTLKEEYQKHWKEDWFKIDASVEEMKWLLMMTDNDQCIQDFYHNQLMRDYLADPEAYESEYHTRNRIEGRHGTEKTFLDMGRISVKGIEKVDAHIGMCMVAMLALALVRIRNGVTDGFVNLGGLA